MGPERDVVSLISGTLLASMSCKDYNYTHTDDLPCSLDCVYVITVSIAESTCGGNLPVESTCPETSRCISFALLTNILWHIR
jgi:hypothetical protein